MKSISIRNWFPAFVLFAWALLSSGCATPEPKAANQKRNFLWEVKSPTTTVYLLGSIHFARADLYPLDAMIEQAFADSKYLVVEANIGLATDILAEVLGRAFYAGDDRIDRHLSPGTLKLLSEKLETNGLSLASFTTFKPWFLAFNLLGLELQKLGITPQNGIDLHFIQSAGEREVLELESAVEQIELLDGFSDLEQEALLLSTLQELETAAASMDEMIAAWRTGDADRLDAFLTQQIGEDVKLKGVYWQLLEVRNRKMLVKIEGYLKSGETHFVVVGAAHLAGKQGLVNLLKKKGYDIRQR